MTGLRGQAPERWEEDVLILGRWGIGRGEIGKEASGDVMRDEAQKESNAEKCFT